MVGYNLYIVLDTPQPIMGECGRLGWTAPIYGQYKKVTKSEMGVTGFPRFRIKGFVDVVWKAEEE